VGVLQVRVLDAGGQGSNRDCDQRPGTFKQSEMCAAKAKEGAK